MTYDFLITIKKQNNSFADQVSHLLHIFSIAVFAFYFFQNPKFNYVYLAVIITMVIFWVVSWMKKKKTGTACFRSGLFVAAIGWLIAPQRNIFMAMLYILAGVLEKQVKLPEQIGFSNNEISFKAFPQKTMQWSEINNIIIKDGLLTIDKKNNKIFQKEIEGFITVDAEKEFNDFCLRQLERIPSEG